MKRIGVFCAASDRLESTFYEEAYALGVWMGNQRLTLVYGGANSGLMEAVARGVHEGGGHIVGVVPRILEERRRESIYLDEIIRCEDLTERKTIMQEQSDAFLALPGGIGTLDEVFTVMASASIGYHVKPVLLYNSSGFWNDLFEWFSRLDRQHFINRPLSDYLHEVRSLSDLARLLSV